MGRNAPGGRRSSSRHVRPERRRQASARRTRRCRARRSSRSATSCCSISVASRSTPSGRSLEQAKQDRRGDVVWQVADHPDLAVGSRVELADAPSPARSIVENVGRDHRHVRKLPRLERRREIAIDLDGQQRVGACRERTGDRARPGTDLEKPIVGAGAIAATSLATQAGSRKCWPNRFRGLTSCSSSSAARRASNALRSP